MMMTKYAVVALVGALVGGGAVWAVRPSTPVEHTDARPHRAPAKREPAARRARTAFTDSDERASLAECKQALLQQRAELRLVREVAARAAEQDLVDDDGLTPSNSPPPRSSNDHESADADAEARRSEHQRFLAANEKVRDSVIERMNITEDEQQIVKDIVCSQRDNLRGLYTDFAEGRMDPEAFFEALRQERALSGEGLQRALGKARYRRLRRVGAVGLLVPRLCKRR